MFEKTKKTEIRKLRVKKNNSYEIGNKIVRFVGHYNLV